MQMQMQISKFKTILNKKQSIWTLVLIIGLLLPFFISKQVVLSLLIIVGIFSIAALAVDLLKGYIGMLPLGHAAFLGIGGYSTAFITVKLQYSPIMGIFTGMIIAGILAWILSKSIVKLSTLGAGLVTLGMGLIMENIFISWRAVTGGGSGYAGIPTLSILGLNLQGDLAYYYFVWLVFFIIFFLSRGLVNSRIGRALKVIKEDPQYAAAISINVPMVKMQIFILSAVITSLAGSLYAHYMQFISPEMVNFDNSAALITMVILGGEGTLIGSVVGAAILKFLPHYIAIFRDYQLLINGLILLGVLFFMPRGLVGYLTKKLKGENSEK